MTDEIKPEDKRSYTPGYDLRPLEEGDVESLLETFNLVFAENNPDFEPRTMEEWRWAYRDNPAGTRVLVATKDGEVAAHFSSLPVRVWIGGEERLFGQSVGSFVHPAHRQGLRRPGLYAKLVWEFQDLYGGRDKDLLHYGWPVWNAWRIGKALLSYEVVRTQNLLVKAVPPDADQGLLEGCERDGLRLEFIKRFDEQLRRRNVKKEQHVATDEEKRLLVELGPGPTPAEVVARLGGEADPREALLELAAGAVAKRAAADRARADVMAAVKGYFFYTA